MDRDWIYKLDNLMTSKGFTEYKPGNDDGPAYNREDILPRLWFKMVETHEYGKEVDLSYLRLSTDCIPFYLKIKDIEELDYYLEEIFIPMLQKNELYRILIDSRASGNWDHPFKKKNLKYNLTEKTRLEIFERAYTPKEIRQIDYKANRANTPPKRRLPSFP